MPGLEVTPKITAILAHRKAASDCHGAPLDASAGPTWFTCRQCGQPCQRVYGDPTEVTAHG